MKANFSNRILTILILSLICASSSMAVQKNEVQFNTLVQKVQAVYSPVVASAGGNLVINSFWNSNILNGFADRRDTQWLIEINGGLYRNGKITDDGLAALLCHELGHHLGGMPFKADSSWMSSEGQADFYSASICLRKVWGREDNLAAIQILSVPNDLKDQCSIADQINADSALCIRIAMAGFSFVEFNRIEHGYASETTAVNFETPAPELNGKALTYPRAQCRLDTFFAGALQKNRPRCWFLPTTDTAN
jgi:hypothetical protein